MRAVVRPCQSSHDSLKLPRTPHQPVNSCSAFEAKKKTACEPTENSNIRHFELSPSYTTINLFFVRSLYLQLSHWTRGFRALLKDTRNQLQIHVVGDGLIYRSLLNPGKTNTSEKCAQEMKAAQESPMPMAGTGQKKGPMISKTTPHSPLHN